MEEVVRLQCEIVNEDFCLKLTGPGFEWEANPYIRMVLSINGQGYTLYEQCLQQPILDFPAGSTIQILRRNNDGHSLVGALGLPISAGIINLEGSKTLLAHIERI